MEILPTLPLSSFGLFSCDTGLFFLFPFFFFHYAQFPGARTESDKERQHQMGHGQSEATWDGTKVSPSNRCCRISNGRGSARDEALLSMGGDSVRRLVGRRADIGGLFVGVIQFILSRLEETARTPIIRWGIRPGGTPRLPQRQHERVCSCVRGCGCPRPASRARIQTSPTFIADVPHLPRACPEARLA